MLNIATLPDDTKKIHAALRILSDNRQFYADSIAPRSVLTSGDSTPPDFGHLNLPPPRPRFDIPPGG